MITHYDMGSCEMIAEPDLSANTDGVRLSLPSVQPRLQTVTEAVQLQPARDRALPPDLAGKAVDAFIDRHV